MPPPSDTARSTPARPGTHPVALLRAVAEGGSDRLTRFDHGGCIYWIKRREALPLRMRLQKGDTGRALRREIAALRDLSGQGLPVPELVAAGEGYLVVPDCGPSLNLLLRDPGRDPARTRRAMAAAGTALAALHGAGIAHGRPSIRDFCWQDGRITLIDWERYRPPPASPHRLRRDAVVFVFNIYALTRGDTPEAMAAIESYRAAAPPGLWDEAARLCRRLRWLDPLTRPLQRRDAGKGEFRAIPLTLARFSR